MLDTFKTSSTAARLAAGIGMLALCAHAQTASARDGNFQQWPADAVGASYRFESVDPALAQSLQYQTYRDMVRASIGSTGLVETQDVATARFTVAFSYGTERTRVTVAQPDPFYDPFYDSYYGYSRWPYGRSGWGGGHYGGVGYYSGGWTPRQVEAFRNTLTVEIRDAQRNGAPVYKATAAAVGDDADMVSAMPYLTQAIFEDFPSNNGQLREVNYRGN